MQTAELRHPDRKLAQGVVVDVELLEVGAVAERLGKEGKIVVGEICDEKGGCKDGDKRRKDRQNRGAYIWEEEMGDA